MRARRSGVVANLGFIGGWLGVPAAGLYCASKAAIAVFTESLRKEVQSLGIEVTAIGPGYVRTNFLSSGHHKSRAANVIVDYKSSIKDNMAGLAAYNRKQTGDPAKRAQIIVKALTKTGHSQDVSPTMHQLVEGLRSLVESEVELSNLAKEMFEQEITGQNADIVPAKRPRVQNFQDLLKALDDLLVRAPDSALDFMMRSGRRDSRSEFQKVFVCDPSKEHWGYRSFDDFFTRKLRAGARPIASPMDSSVITHPCEACPYQIDISIRAREPFCIKGQHYSLQDILAGHAFTSVFTGGTIYQGYLRAGGYHRYHCPVDGYIRAIHHIPGLYFPRPQKEEDFTLLEFVASQNLLAQMSTRALIFIQADNPDIGLMCVVPVGMNEVSTCEVTVRERQRVAKGDELGMFHYGGSTHCIIFRPGVLLDFDLHGERLGSQSGVVPVNAKIAKVLTR
ncbi:MAG: hypothetical protein Q9200_000870 [Gallowayella weberi]